jgi:pyruvate/2-oxoglutarate dehydrogenase complex dihydrolipoamide acyltransferase (E2) component
MQASILRGTKLAMVGGLALAAGFLATRAKADDWDKKTILTVNEPIQITDTYLQPGTYVLMLDRDSQSNRHIVRIYNDQQNHLINTVLAFPAYRVRVTGNTQFTFWETSPGSARALRDWFWPGDNFGQEFAYPKNLRQVNQVSSTKAPAAAPQAQAEQSQPQPEQPQVQAEAPEQSASQSQAQVQQQPSPQSQAEAPEQAAQQPPAEVQEQDVIIIAQATPQTQAQPSYQGQASQGQNNQGQNDQAQNSQDQNNQGQANEGQTQHGQPPAQPQQLPQTASQYPLVGLMGLFSLGLYGLLRAKRTA